MVAVRADLSLAEPLGKANAAITLLKAAVSSSTSKSISSFNCCAFTAQSLKYLSLSSQPRLPADKLATIPPRETPVPPLMRRQNRHRARENRSGFRCKTDADPTSPAIFSDKSLLSLVR